jgi:hypothetical protein
MRTTTVRKSNNRTTRAARATAYRTRFARLAAKVDRDRTEAARFRYVCDADLTSAERDAINDALRDALCDHGGEVPYGGAIEVAYHAELPLSSAWMLFGASDGESVGVVRVVFDRLGLAFDLARCDAEWMAYHDKWSVACPNCRTVAYGQPGGDTAQRQSRGTWPDTCENCHADIKPHYHEIIGEGTAWWADCTCGWNKDDGPTYKSRASAQGQVTRHLRAVEAARGAAHAERASLVTV